MKVAHLTSVHVRYDTRIFVKQCCSLAKKGDDVTLIVADGKGDEVKDDVSIIDVGESKGRFDRFFSVTQRIFERAKTIDADIFHFHDPELIPIGLKLKKIGKKVIFDSHEDVPRQLLSKPYIPKNLRSIIAFLFEKFENFSVQKLDAIICATPLIEERFKSLGCRTENVNNYPILNELTKISIPWNQKEKAVCYVGGLTKIRGLFEMIEAIGKTDGTLLMGGRFFLESEQTNASAMKGWHHIQYAGFLSRVGVAETLSKSMAGLVVLHPTLNYLESLPVKMFEYMSAGLPVIASNFPLWQKIMDENSCGLYVDPLDSKDIAKAIQWIFEHPEQAEIMGKNARYAVENYYNWENEFIKLYSLYLEILSKN